MYTARRLVSSHYLFLQLTASKSARLSQRGPQEKLDFPKMLPDVSRSSDPPPRRDLFVLLTHVINCERSRVSVTVALRPWSANKRSQLRRDEGVRAQRRRRVLLHFTSFPCSSQPSRNPAGDPFWYSLIPPFGSSSLLLAVFALSVVNRFSLERWTSCFLIPQLLWSVYRSGI